MLHTAMFSTALLILLGCVREASAGSVVLNSNAIKVGPGVASPVHPVSPSPDEIPTDTGSQNIAIDTPQPLICESDEECGDEEFCFLSRGVCLQCKKRRKRCIRDAMCCPGNHCSNGVCQPYDPDMIQQIGMEEFVSITHENSTVVVQPKVATQGSPQNQILKGLEGENCLRSSDCAEGLCCARHFWSKMCKPVLKEGQVCTKHKRKGTHGLEIFQRCDCGEGLSCRTQRGDGSKSSRSLHTCQRH
ncbi:dickkopf-related protein 1b isoform X2 [Myxocyprinus asiaticus]|uniref:dickkopf-related protein 1b isoform X2 n=1 Tax=Myxocyprinus asiaticus TaxID=70543 RepID=UPI00222279CA|nr:dickkopf-related protein 1b isoform X2 [Myxocyprinus asiaticus]